MRLVVDHISLHMLLGSRRAIVMYCNMMSTHVTKEQKLNLITTCTEASLKANLLHLCSFREFTVWNLMSIIA